MEDPVPPTLPRRISLLLEIELQEDGSLHSSHTVRSEDIPVLRTWPSGGLVHLSHSLFIEAMRRESYTMAISILSTGVLPQDLTAEDIERRARVHLIELINRYSKDFARDALESIQEKS